MARQALLRADYAVTITGTLLRHSCATVDTDGGRLSAPPERLPSNQELLDLQGKPEGVTPLWTASNPGSGTDRSPAHRRVFAFSMAGARQSARLAPAAVALLTPAAPALPDLTRSSAPSSRS